MPQISTRDGIYNGTPASIIKPECSISLHGGRHREAIDYFNKILSLDGIDNLPFVKYDCYNNMHTAYSLSPDFGDFLCGKNKKGDSLTTIPIFKYTIIYKTTI